MFATQLPLVLLTAACVIGGLGVVVWTLVTSR
jgi:hypothetical protein